VAASKPAAPKLLASKVKIYKPEEVDIPNGYQLQNSARKDPIQVSKTIFQQCHAGGVTWFWTSVLWKL
jgi:hypothetical protein